MQPHSFTTLFRDSGRGSIASANFQLITSTIITRLFGQRPDELYPFTHSTFIRSRPGKPYFTPRVSVPKFELPITSNLLLPATGELATLLSCALGLEDLGEVGGYGIFGWCPDGLPGNGQGV